MLRAAVLLLLTSALCQAQETEPQREDIFIALPEFYWSFQENPRPASIGAGYELNAPPKGKIRRYFISCAGENGMISESAELDEPTFYTLTKRILSYGVSDTALPCNGINRGYQNFVRNILRYNIISEAELRRVGKGYRGSHWIESLYCLQEVVPDLITKEEWKSEVTQSLNDYCVILSELAAGTLPDTVRMWLDSRLPRQSGDESESTFRDFAPLYAILVSKGVGIAPPIQKRLLLSFLNGRFLVDSEIRKAYADLRLPIPDKEVLASAMKDFIESLDYPASEIVSECRSFGIGFPKEHARVYRDRLLARGGDLEDVLYLVREAGEDAKPELWEKYAYSALRGYLRKFPQESDCYRAAVEGYRRGAEAGVAIDHSITERLVEAVDDASVRMRDLITAYRLAGRNLKSELVIGQLERRLEYSHDFRDEIDLAAFVGDPERIKTLSRKISLHFFEKLKKEWSPSADSQTFKDLPAILDVYEELKFTAGARSLAFYLFDLGFELPARRAFHLGGLGKEAEEQYYKNFCDDELKKRQEAFNAKAQKPRK